VNLIEEAGPADAEVRRLRFTGSLVQGHFDVIVGLINNVQTSETQKRRINDVPETTNTKTKKRRKRFENVTRQSQLKSAAVNFKKNNPSRNQMSVEKYQAKKPEVNKECVKRYQAKRPEVNKKWIKSYQAKNPDVNKKCVKTYQAKNPDLNKNCVKTYQDKNPDVNKNCARVYQTKNPERHRQRVQAYENNHPERVNANQLNRRCLPWKSKNCSAFDYNPQIEYENDKLFKITEVVCKWCSAIKFNEESPGLCCASG
jgi:hypothetical protein